MRFTVDYPVVTPGYDLALVTAAGVTRVAQAAEECGYDAISFSEHPAPSQKWLSAGGHEALDQTSALAFCAAVTSRVRLMTYLLVLPYHNPFLALNVDLEQRNEIFDESLEVLRGVWTQVPYAHQGKHFTARGVASLPGPVQPRRPAGEPGGGPHVAHARHRHHRGAGGQDQGGAERGGPARRGQ